MSTNMHSERTRLLIAAATSKELAAILPSARNNSIVQDVSLTLLPNGEDRVGAVPTAVAIMKAAALHRFDFAVSIGFCGARKLSLPIGGNVLVTHDCFFDYGFMRTTGFIPLHNTPFPLAHCDSNGWLTATSPSLLALAPASLPACRGYTLSHPSLGEPIAPFHRPFPNDSIETMEGAAFAYVTSELKIPALTIRTVSNYCAQGDAAQWNIQKAQEGVRKALITALEIIQMYLKTQNGTR